MPDERGTQAHASEELLRRAEAALDRIGHRLTSQRRWVLQRFAERIGSHLTPDAVCSLAEADGAHIGQATIYRTLELCEDAGLLYRFDDPAGRSLYELNVYDPHLHHHLICLGCGEITHYNEELALGIQQVLERERGFVLVDHALQLLGYCRLCAQEGIDVPVAAAKERPADGGLALASERLAALGYRLTQQRQAIFRVLLGRRGYHWSPDEVCEAAAADEPGLGIATVYRTLELFVKLGLADALDDVSGHQRFEPAAGAFRAHHHHLLCRRCGRIDEYEGNLIGCIALGLVDSGFSLAQRSLRLVGECCSCRDAGCA